MWLVDVTLKWLPGFRSNYLDIVREDAEGHPNWFQPWFRFWIHLMAPRATLFACLVAATEPLIALALILRVRAQAQVRGRSHLQPARVGRGGRVGGPYASGASDIGTAVIYALVFASLLVLNARSGPARFSVDALIERRVSWWYRIAEVGHRAERHATVGRSAPAAAIATDRRVSERSLSR